MENNKIKNITPQFIELNITELCNRVCSFCPRALDYPNLNLNMNVKTAIKIKEQAINFVDAIHIVGRGEPLLHPDLLNILAVLSNDFYIRLMTNGDHLHKHIDQLHRLLDLNSGKHRITISLYDGEDQYKFLKEQFRDYADIRYWKTYDNGQGTADIEFNEKHYIANRAGALYTAKSDQPCYIPLNRMFIDWDGSVNLCCHDWTIKATYGNIHSKNLKDIYKFIVNKYAKELVQGNRSCTKQCSLCDVPSSDPLKYVYNDYLINQEARINEIKF